MTSTATPAAILSPVWRSVLADSYRALQTVVAGVADDQWHIPTPCAQWSVTQVIQHAAGDQLAYAKFLGIGIGPSYDPFAPSGTIDGTADELIRTAVEQTAAAWATVADDTDAVPTPLPHGALPTPVAATIGALDAAVHAWDIAVATGQQSPLDDELAGYLLAAATDLIEPLRQWGAYADIVAPGARTVTRRIAALPGPRTAGLDR